MIPWANFGPSIIPTTGGGAEQHLLMSEILFLSVKEHAGKLRSAEGIATAAGDVASLTANTGKDMYLASAKVTFALEGLSNQQAAFDEVVLKINGTVVETAKSSMVITAGEGGNTVHTYEFKNIGHKVAASQIIKMEAITVDADTTIEGVH